MTQCKWNTFLESCGMVLGLGGVIFIPPGLAVIALILRTILFTGGCGIEPRVPVGDSWSDEDARDDEDDSLTGDNPATTTRNKHD